MELSFDFRGAKLAARVWGPEDGEPWLAFHGWLDNAGSFDNLAEHLQPNMRVVAVDMAGHGHSSWHANGAYHLVDYAMDGCHVADQLGWLQRGFSVLGHSLGAGVAMLVAAMAGPACQRLVLLDGFGPGVSEDHEVAGLLLQAVAEARLLATPQPTGKATIRVYPDLEAAALKRQQGNVVGTITLEATRTLCKRGCKPAPGAGKGKVPIKAVVWSADPALKLASRQRLTNGAVCSLLGRVRCPVLLCLASDGMLGRSLSSRLDIMGGSLVALVALLAMRTVASLVQALLHGLDACGLDLLHSGVAKACKRTLFGAGWGLNLVRRARALGSVLTTVDVGTGGHHIHMTRPSTVAKTINSWVRES